MDWSKELNKALANLEAVTKKTEAMSSHLIEVKDIPAILQTILELVEATEKLAKVVNSCPIRTLTEEEYKAKVEAGKKLKLAKGGIH